MTVAEYYHGLGVVHRTDGNCPVCDNPAVKINQKGAVVLKAVKRHGWKLVAIFVVLAAWTVLFHPDWVVGGLPPHKNIQHSMMVSSDKYDGDCTGHETVGRCADKCPEGAYLQGYDKETGAAVCKVEPNPECPYAASVQAGTPLCDKLQAEQQPQPIQPIQQPNYQEFQGK